MAKSKIKTPRIKAKAPKKITKVNPLIPILIKTISNVFKTIHINPKNKYKYKSAGKLPKDRRKSIFSKKREYYIKENIPQTLRRIKRKDPREYERLKSLKDKEDYDSYDDEYARYLESKAEREEVAEERKIERRKAKAKRKGEREVERAKELAQPIRIWAKVRYNGDNPLFIEAFIDGRTKDEASLRAELLEFIMSNFNEDVGSLAEVGIENVSRISKDTPQLKYKSSLMAGWNTL